MALITIATDDPAEAKKLFEALYGDPRQLPMLPPPFDGAVALATEQPAARGRGRPAKAPEQPTTATITTQAPAAPPPVLVEAAPPPVPVPPPAPVVTAPPPAPPSPPPAPAPAPAPAPDAALPAADGWTHQHVLEMAAAFVGSPKGGPEALQRVLAGHPEIGTPLTVKGIPPHLWHVVYGELAAILEAG